MENQDINKIITRDTSTQDTYYLKLQGKAVIPTPLEIGHNIQVGISGSITEKKENDNDDGSRSFTWRFEPILVTVIKETGETIKARDIRKKSQQLRSAVWKEWNALGNSSVCFEDFYNERMDCFIKEVLDN